MHHESQDLQSRLPPPPPPPSSRHSKVVSQREYREKEIECFNMLRDAIQTITGEELRTRQEILKKATDLLLYYSKGGKQSLNRASPLVANEASNSTLESEDAVTTVHWQSGSSSQSSYWSQSNAEFGVATSYHDAHFRDQRSNFMFAMGSTSDQSISTTYDSSDYPQLEMPGFLPMERMD